MDYWTMCFMGQGRRGDSIDRDPYADQDAHEWERADLMDDHDLASDLAAINGED